jgi:hypothetical protein
MRIHALAAVCDRQHGIGPGDGPEVGAAIAVVKADLPGFDAQASAVGHGMSGVDAQVHDDLFELDVVGPNNRQVFYQAGFNLDHARQRAPEKFHLGTQFDVQVNRLKPLSHRFKKVARIALL